MAFSSALDELATPAGTPAQRLREALSLFEDGVEMKRRSLRRQYPDAPETEIEARILRWLQDEDAS